MPSASEIGHFKKRDEMGKEKHAKMMYMYNDYKKKGILECSLR
jgi:hypothetical protein